MGPSSASHSGSTDVTHCMNLIKRVGRNSVALRRIRLQSGGNQEALCCTHEDQQRAIIIIIIISVLLGSHHELVVDYVLGLHAHPVECR